MDTFDRASREQGVKGTNLLIALETRLDNIVYRMGFATNRKGARQLVRHGHVQVNGERVDIPSYRVVPGAIVRSHHWPRPAANMGGTPPFAWSTNS